MKKALLFKKGLFHHQVHFRYGNDIADDPKTTKSLAEAD